MNTGSMRPASRAVGGRYTLLFAGAVLIGIAVLAVLLGRPAATSEAAGQPQLALDAAQTGKDADACLGGNGEKCTLNVGDTFDIEIRIKDFKGISGGDYGNWSFTLNSSGVSFKSGQIKSSACLGLGRERTVDTTDPSSVPFSCTNADGTSTSALLAVASFNCTASGNVEVKGVGIDGVDALGGSIDIHCGESATMGLSLKPEGASTEIFVKDEVTVSIEVGDLKLKDVDGDGEGGYLAWQALVNFPEELKLVDVDVKQPSPAQTARQDRTNAVLLGATVPPTDPEETDVEGNVVNLTFACNEPGEHTITLKDTDETFLVSEKGAVVDSTIDPSATVLDCRAAQMALDVKGGAKTSFGDTYWVPKGETFTVSVELLQIVNLTYDEASAKLEFDDESGVIEFTAPGFPNPPCVGATGTASLASPPTTVTVSCTTTDAGANADHIGNIFNITFTCADTAPGDVSEQTIGLADLGTETKLVNKAGDDIKPFVTNELTIRCVGEETDKDEDGCTVAQEAAFDSPLDPNVKDFWDTNGDEIVNVIDILAYVQQFGQPATNTVQDTTIPALENDNSDSTIAVADITNVVLLFGTDCIGSPLAVPKE